MTMMKIIRRIIAIVEKNGLISPSVQTTQMQGLGKGKPQMMRITIVDSNLWLRDSSLLKHVTKKLTVCWQKTSPSCSGMVLMKSWSHTPYPYPSG